MIMRKSDKRRNYASYPTESLFLSKDLGVAIIAFPVHDADISAAFRASPFFFLFRKPLLYPDLFYPSQIIDHVQIIITMMTPIELNEIFTGEIAALETKFYLVFSDQSAIFLDEGTILILYPATLASVFQVFFLQ